MNYVQHAHGKWAYQKSGKGQEYFLVFHGFGQTYHDMLPFDQIRKPGQTFLFFDMFYHGHSQWTHSEKPLDRQIWKELIHKLQQQEGFQDFHLIGYSMGGKFALLTYELLPASVKSLTLLAPDGIKTGLWYSMSSYPNYLHVLFKRVVFKPQRFFGLVEGLNSAGLVEKSLVKFVKTQMETRSKRAQAYFIWKVFGNIQLQLGKIIRQSRSKSIPMTLFIGEFDKMVSAENLERFSSKIPHLRKIILPIGHGGLIEAAAEHLRTNG
ncbi:alpha/beta fold hydrolase [Algoriphagus sp. AK58]|uniref:alpha/beta fold hydrolase n=1 Tax=Algoriphagus sp. AK58 TaxID=1406877 RepID=UPI001650BEBD|nr:alpha/beta hydrolase [Algoriphagus sp. AK58]MBC6368483.1 alpha/beta hydrolase [Algoriphagus sp. AK58]